MLLYIDYLSKAILLISAMTRFKNVFHKKPHSIESAKICIKFPNLKAKKRLSKSWVNKLWNQYNKRVQYGWTQFYNRCHLWINSLHLFLILKSDDAWQQILPFMTLLELAYTTLLIAVALLMLVLLKIAFDICDLIRHFNTPPKGMFFYIRKIVCMYIKNSF